MACDPDKQSGPRYIEVPFFVAPGNGEHAWQCLDYTCGVTVAFTWMEARMEAIIERCCGLDVHQETVVACVLIGAAGQRPRKEVRTFRTMTRDLEALREWLQDLGVTQVGMESTGVYWRPVYAVLEGHFDLIVGNARHIRNVPGRKTDVKDAEWIADLVRHGLIAKSFVPPAPQRELRELLRYRRKLVESQAAERNRLLKLLETANIKLASVASDVFGVSGRAMLKALIEGSSSAEAMADLARGQLRRKRDDLVLALEGRMEEHGTIRNFVCGRGIVGRMEIPNVPTQRACYPRRDPRPIAGRGRRQDGLRSERPDRPVEEGAGRSCAEGGAGSSPEG